MTLHPPFINVRHFGSPSSSSQGSSSVCCFGVLMGGLHSPPLLHLIIMGGLHSPPLILLVILGSPFSSSPVGIMVAMAGSSSWLPILGGSASLAIPPSVTHEIQDELSLAAPPLTNVGALPLTVDSHPSLLGSSQDVSGGATSPPP